MRNDYLTSLNSLPYFDTSMLQGLFPDVPKAALNTYVSNWVKSEKIYRLLKGVYTTREAYLQFKSTNAYRELIAIRLSVPAYLSTEYVLAKHEVLTEGVSSITAVTLKERKDTTNILGNFIFRQITPTLFTGYIPKYFLQYEYYEATKVKALFDFLYYRCLTLNERDLTPSLFEELRLNLDWLDPKDLKEFVTYVELHETNKTRKLYALLDTICTRYHSHHHVV